MNYCDLSVLKDRINNEDSILVLIARNWIENTASEMWNVAEKKNCEIEDITEQDCVDFLKKYPKFIQVFFRRNNKFFVNNIKELEKLQERGILDKLPNGCEIYVFDYVYDIDEINKEIIEEINGKKLFFENNINFPIDTFNYLIEIGLKISNYNRNKITIKGLNPQNIDCTIENISKYPNERFSFPISANLEDSENIENLQNVLNYDFNVNNFKILLNVDANNTNLSNLFNILSQSTKNFERIEEIVFDVKNENIILLEQIIQSINLIDSNNFPKVKFNITLDEKYIKSLDKSIVEKIDKDLLKLRNNENILVSIGYNAGIENYNEFYFDDINSCFKLYNQTEDIIGCIPKDASDFDKVTYISNWIMQNFTYDYESYYKKIEWEQQHPNESPDSRDRPRLKYLTLVQFIEQKKGVCQDVAILTEYLLKKVGVECEWISSPPRHSFNIVYIDGTPYWMDNTWDINMHDENEDYQLSDSEYFLTSYEDFSKTHSKYDAINYRPKCPKTMDREEIKLSLERISHWKHILDQSIIGTRLYADTRSSDLSQAENLFNENEIKNEGEKRNGRN